MSLFGRRMPCLPPFARAEVPKFGSSSRDKAHNGTAWEKIFLHIRFSVEALSKLKCIFRVSGAPGIFEVGQSFHIEYANPDTDFYRRLH